MTVRSLRQIPYRCFFVLVPLYFGAMLFSFDAHPTPTNTFVNLPWGFAYGLGWYVFGRLWGLSSATVELVGVFVWPSLVLWFQIWLSGKVWNASRGFFIGYSLLLLLSFGVDI